MLDDLVDSDRINHGQMRFSVGAVNVRSSTIAHTIRPEHVMETRGTRG